MYVITLHESKAKISEIKLRAINFKLKAKIHAFNVHIYNNRRTTYDINGMPSGSYTKDYTSFDYKFSTYEEYETALEIIKLYLDNNNCI